MQIDILYICIILGVLLVIAACYLLKKLLIEDEETCSFIKILYALSSSIQQLSALQLIAYTFLVALIILSGIIASFGEEYRIGAMIISFSLIIIIVIIALIWKFKDKQLETNLALAQYQEQNIEAEVNATKATSESDLGD